MIASLNKGSTWSKVLATTVRAVACTLKRRGLRAVVALQAPADDAGHKTARLWWESGDNACRGFADGKEDGSRAVHALALLTDTGAFVKSNDKVRNPTFTVRLWLSQALCDRCVCDMRYSLWHL
jgi:hypothetical protein